MRPPWSVLLPLALSSVAPARAQDADDYDPLLDRSEAPAETGPRKVEADPRAPGFTIGGGLGLYFGKVKSFLTRRESRLDSGLRPAVGVGLGYRTRSRVELGLDAVVGFGLTYEPELDDDISAFDLLIEPRLFVHLVQGDDFGLYVGPTYGFWSWDVALDGVNQTGHGPGLLLGLIYRLDGHSLVFLEGTGAYIYDLLAYHFEEPTEEELALDPTLLPEKVEGEWFGVFRVTVGYRLTAF